MICIHLNNFLVWNTSCSRLCPVAITSTLYNEKLLWIKGSQSICSREFFCFFQTIFMGYTTLQSAYFLIWGLILCHNYWLWGSIWNLHSSYTKTTRKIIFSYLSSTYTWLLYIYILQNLCDGIVRNAGAYHYTPQTRQNTQPTNIPESMTRDVRSFSLLLDRHWLWCCQSPRSMWMYRQDKLKLWL